LALAIVVLWVVMCGSSQRDFIRFDRLDMFRNYDGLRYAEAGIFYVPRSDVDWVNAWLAGCPTLASPGLIFWNSLTGALATEISTRGLDEHALTDFPARLSFAAAASPPWEDEWRALGGALGLKLRADRAAFERLLRDARLKTPTGDWLREGFTATESRGVAGLCPADPPEIQREDFKATVLERRWSRRAVP
jgi:hypothetical protein